MGLVMYKRRKEGEGGDRSLGERTCMETGGKLATMSAIRVHRWCENQIIPNLFNGDRRCQTEKCMVS